MLLLFPFISCGTQNYLASIQPHLITDIIYQKRFLSTVRWLPSSGEKGGEEGGGSRPEMQAIVCNHRDSRPSLRHVFISATVVILIPASIANPSQPPSRSRPSLRISTVEPEELKLNGLGSDGVAGDDAECWRGCRIWCGEQPQRQKE
ncbi:hypothetical protein TIFTF001_007712 [Ficus carica]|uniref:Uncharacterized protein n=1 Tax=Ficus carica TaxID=3494 RepID=A0AA88ADV1_FICCA|nr:hypothetical protein TIFTF001_007712 [Ficus carica]